MPRLNNAKRIHIWLETDDIEWYKARFGSPGEIGFSGAIQKILKTWRRLMESKMEASSSAKLNLEEEIEL
jgi:hypothetical protein